MNVRVETRGAGGWDQPVVVVHPDPRMARGLAVVCADAIYERLRIPVRCTVGDNPTESGKWGEADADGVEVTYRRGG